MKEKEKLCIIDFINKASKSYVKFKIINNKIPGMMIKLLV